MWCSSCQAVVHEGLLTCPSCGGEPAAPSAERAATGFDVDLCGFLEAAPCQEAMRVLGGAGIRSEMILRSPDVPASSPVEYWLAVRPEDRARAQHVLMPGEAATCAVCGTAGDASATLCLHCGQPR